MNISQAGEPPRRKPLRLWPAVVIVVLQLALTFGVRIIAPGALQYAVFGGVLCAVFVLLWWLFFSRAPWSERLGAVGFMIVAWFATSRVIDKSIATGAMGFLFPMLSLPILGLAFAAWAVATSRLSDGLRRATMVVTILLACGGWALIRTGGFSSDMHNDFMWRWTKNPEERLIAQPGSQLPMAPVAPAVPVSAKIPAEPTVARAAEVKPVKLASTPVAAAQPEAEWPGFRGPNRDSIIRGIEIKTDWSASPPVELWRRPIGPGWGSFAVHGDLIYTQEQRGDDEFVTCYNAATGKPVWAHRDVARFWESNAGAGPRATPTLHDGRLYTLGATGIVNALDAADGAVLWTRNAATDTGVKVPGWGFASSPLVVGDLVVVAASGELIAYDAATGKPRWTGAAAGGGYSSPHLMTIDGVPQILLMSSLGAASVAPADGKLLWKYPWPSDTRIMQPAMTADGDLIFTGGDAMGGVGIRRIAVTHGPTGWTTQERWTSIALKPNFNDFVVYDGYIYGFDGGILACVDLQDGKRKWKGGRYGAGQLVLLRDQGVLLVVSEEGELGLVKAAPDQFTELAHAPALDGKTWNHPVLVADRLLVRNGSEMAAFRLSLERP